jgi:predicted PurR-regulated permease PerM
MSEPETEKPARTARIAFVMLFALSASLVGYIVWPFRAPLFLALVSASLLHSVCERTIRRVGGRRLIGALLTTLALIVIIVGPVGTGLGFIGGQVLKGLIFVRDVLGIHSVEQLHQGGMSTRGEALADRVVAMLHLSRAQLDDGLRYAVTTAQGATQRIVAGSPRLLVQAVVMLIAFYFFLVEAPKLYRWLERLSPLQSHQTRHLLAEFRSVSRASILGATLSALYQALAATLGFFITGVPHAVFFGVLLLFSSLIPVIGTLVVWVPAVALLWLFGHHAMAIVLLIWSVVFVVAGEQVAKPFILRKILHSDQPMHAGLISLSLLGGIFMFGLIGLVLGPLAIAFFLAMVRIYERDFAPRVQS